MYSYMKLLASYQKIKKTLFYRGNMRTKENRWRLKRNEKTVQKKTPLHQNHSLFGPARFLASAADDLVLAPPARKSQVSRRTWAAISAARGRPRPSQERSSALRMPFFVFFEGGRGREEEKVDDEESKELMPPAPALFSPFF